MHQGVALIRGHHIRLLLLLLTLCCKSHLSFAVATQMTKAIACEAPIAAILIKNKSILQEFITIVRHSRVGLVVIGSIKGGIVAGVGDMSLI